jgi:hypothetical protein
MTRVPVYRTVRKLTYHNKIVWREPDRATDSYLSSFPGAWAVGLAVSSRTIVVFNEDPPIPQAEVLVRTQVDMSICRDVQSSVWQSYTGMPVHLRYADR